MCKWAFSPCCRVDFDNRRETDVRIWCNPTCRLLLPFFLFCALGLAAGSQPIQLNPKNPHYFLFRGKAIALITSGEHYGSVINADFDYRRYLSTIHADGMNYTRLFGGSYVELPGKSFGILRNTLAPGPGRYIAPWARSATPGYAGGGNKFDLDKWNPEYFSRLRDFLSNALSKDIVVELTLFSSQYGDAQWELSPFRSANNVNGTSDIDRKKLATSNNGTILAFQERYTRRLVHECNGFDNVILEIQNEPWSDRPEVANAAPPYPQPWSPDPTPKPVEIADAASLEWQAKVAGWIASEETKLPNKHLVAQCYSNFSYPIQKLSQGVSIVNFHYAYPDAVRANYKLGAAIAADETGFAGRDDNTYQRQAWKFMLSGGGIFDSLDYSFSPGHEDGRDLEQNGPGGGSPTLRHQLHILSQFLQSFSLANLRPDTVTAFPEKGLNTYALSNPGHEYAIYLDGDGPANLSLTLPEGTYAFEWIDVLTGAVRKLPKFNHPGGVMTLRTPEFQGGIALRVRER